MIHGSIVALITPFRDGRLDEEVLTKMVEWRGLLQRRSE